MNLRIPGSDLAWKSKARVFAERHLFPSEVELERTGHLPAETLVRLREALVGHGLNASTTARSVVARALTQLQQVLVNEEVGKARGALWAVL